MSVTDKLNNLIDLAGQGFKHIGYNSFQVASDLDNLRNAKAFFTTTVLGMQAVSKVIEDQALNLGKPFQLYSAFQKFSRFKGQEERYLKLAATQNQIYIFGVPDISLNRIPNINQVILEPVMQQPNMTNFWFVVLNSPNFVSMALLAREVPSRVRVPNTANRLLYRSFEGFWTYETVLVEQIVSCLNEYVTTQSKFSYHSPSTNYANSVKQGWISSTLESDKN